MGTLFTLEMAGASADAVGPKNGLSPAELEAALPLAERAQRALMEARERGVAGFLDLLTIMMLSRFSLKPLHFFGTIGLVMGAAGSLVSLYLVGVRFHYGNIQGRTPLLMLGVLLIIVGIQALSTGLLAELIARSLSREKAEYSVERRIPS